MEAETREYGSTQNYHQLGFMVVSAFTTSEVKVIESFVKSWVYNLLDPWIKGKRTSFPLETYHVWSETLQVDHAGVLKASNRHTSPPKEVRQALWNKKVQSIISELIGNHFELWDEGLGWLGFRLIRPNKGDGYPMSRKAWGAATNVVSCWIPVIGFSPTQTLTLVPGSHLKEYKKYLPHNTQFCPGEYRLDYSYHTIESYRPSLNAGEAILFHPMTLHSEEMGSGSMTRLSLEFRVKPVLKR